MGKYDKAAEGAMNATLKEFAGDIKQLKTSNLAKMFPAKADQALINELISKVDKATDKNELITAFQVIGAKLTVEGAKALKGGFSLAKKLAI